MKEPNIKKEALSYLKYCLAIEIAKQSFVEEIYERLKPKRVRIGQKLDNVKNKGQKFIYFNIDDDSRLYLSSDVYNDNNKDTYEITIEIGVSIPEPKDFDKVNSYLVSNDFKSDNKKEPEPSNENKSTLKNKKIKYLYYFKKPSPLICSKTNPDDMYGKLEELLVSTINIIKILPTKKP